MPHFRAMRTRPPMARARRDAAAEQRAEWERQDGITDRGPNDCREIAPLDLRPFGGPLLTARPARGKIAWVWFDEEVEEVVLRCTAKEALHALADKLPRHLGARSML